MNGHSSCMTQQGQQTQDLYMVHLYDWLLTVTIDLSLPVAKHALIGPAVMKLMRSFVQCETLVA